MLFQLEWRNFPWSLQVDQSRNAAEIGGVDVGMERAAMIFRFLVTRREKIVNEACCCTSPFLPNGRSSAIAAVGLKYEISQQWAGYLPVGAKALRTAAISSEDAYFVPIPASRGAMAGKQSGGRSSRTAEMA